LTLMIVGTIIITIGALSVVWLPWAHTTIYFGSVFVMLAALLYVIYTWDKLIKEGTADIEKPNFFQKMGALLRDPLKFGPGWQMVFMNFTVSGVGIFMAIKLEEIFRVWPHREERITLTGHWHILAALIATITLMAVIYLIYRRDYAAARKAPSPAPLARLEKDAQITDPLTLKRSLLVVGVMMALFFASEQLGMPPSVVGFIGATALLVWVRPNVEQMLSEVDWTTLVFFMSLFIVVGGVQEVGLIQWIADFIARIAGADLLVASLSVLGLSAVASAIVNNIPFTTAALPIAAFLTRTVPGAGNNVLYWSLSLGANMGGNATYIGSAPNVVAVGILDRAGYRVTFVDWLKVGIPVTFATVLVPTIWLWIRYFWLKF